MRIYLKKAGVESREWDRDIFYEGIGHKSERQMFLYYLVQCKIPYIESPRWISIYRECKANVLFSGACSSIPRGQSPTKLTSPLSSTADLTSVTFGL